MRNGSLVGSENEYEAGYAMCYDENHTGSDNKDPENNAQSYLDICAVLSSSLLFACIIHEALFSLFSVSLVAAFKDLYFSRRFSERALSQLMYRSITNDSARLSFYT